MTNFVYIPIVLVISIQVADCIDLQTVVHFHEGETVELECAFEWQPQHTQEYLKVDWLYPNSAGHKLIYEVEYGQHAITSYLTINNATYLQGDGVYKCRLLYDDKILNEKCYNVQLIENETVPITPPLEIYVIAVAILFVFILCASIICIRRRRKNHELKKLSFYQDMQYVPPIKESKQIGK